jgi:hypothetical protein
MRPEDLNAALDFALNFRRGDANLTYARGLVGLSLDPEEPVDEDFIQAFVLGRRDPKLIDHLIQDDDSYQNAMETAADHGSAATRLMLCRGGRLAVQGRWLEAADIYEDVIADSVDHSWLRRYQLLAFLAGGDEPSFRRARGEVVDQILTVANGRKVADPEVRSDLAWLAALAPGDADDFWEMISGRKGDLWALSLETIQESPFRAWNVSELPEKCTLVYARGYVGGPRMVYLGQRLANGFRSLGAVQCRAGKFADAKKSFEEGIRLSYGKASPQDWAFMALVCHALGDHGEAVRWLNRFRDRRPSDHPLAFWNELEIRLLRSEAEAVVLYDPIFPANPFSPPPQER